MVSFTHFDDYGTLDLKYSLIFLHVVTAGLISTYDDLLDCICHTSPTIYYGSKKQMAGCIQSISTHVVTPCKG